MQVTGTLPAVAAECFSTVYAEGNGDCMEKLSGILSPADPGSLWPMVALIGVAGVVMGVLQAVRRKPGTAIMSLLCGASLLGLYGVATRGDGGHAPWVVRFDSGVPGAPRPPEAPEYRSVVRVYPEQIVRDIDAKVSDFIETKVAPRSRRAGTTLLSTLALGVMVYLAFVFVDTGARGQFTWTLRSAAVLAFVGICTALWYFVP